MASASSSTAAAMIPFTFLPTNEKLNRTNFQSWKAQVVSALKGAQLGHLLNSTKHQRRWIQEGSGA